MRQLRTCGGQSCCSHSRALWDRPPAPVQGCPSGLAYPWPLASQGAAGMRPAGWILTSWLCLTPFSLLSSAPWPESRPLCRFLWLGPLARQVGVGCRLPARSGGGAVTTAVSPSSAPGRAARPSSQSLPDLAGVRSRPSRPSPPGATNLLLSFLTGSPLSSAPSHLVSSCVFTVTSLLFRKERRCG